MAVSNQTSQHIHKKVYRATMASMLNLGNVLELINDSFDNGALVQQDFVGERHQLIVHVVTDIGKQQHLIVVPELSDQFGRDVAAVAEQLAEQVLGVLRAETASS